MGMEIGMGLDSRVQSPPYLKPTPPPIGQCSEHTVPICVVDCPVGQMSTIPTHKENKQTNKQTNK